MNFLAHLFLSPDDEEIRFGNFIADSVKGKMFDGFSKGVQEGILFHRFIDQYTDTHRLVKTSKERLSTKFGKFSAVIVDIYYDHFLAVKWPKYHDLPLQAFAQQQYTLIANRFFLLPPKSKRIFPYMQSQDWLSNYADLVFLQKVFEGMSKRTSFDSQMETATAFLIDNYDAFEIDFELFFPELINASSNFLLHRVSQYAKNQY
jgi:acyl carrier protein phosphodiesterase